MKKLTVLLVVGMFVTLTAFAYQTGGRSQSSFGANGAAAANKNAGGNEKENAAKTTRTFTNYGSRHNWSQGVQTQGVQTSLAGQQVSNFQAPSAQANSATATKKGAVDAPAATGKPAPAPVVTGSQAIPTQASSQPAAGMGGDPMAAAMQQIQGMQDMMKSLGGGMPNVPGMPDLSQIMNSASGGKPSGK